MIDSCGFGKIIIDGSKYTSDLILFPDGRIADNWRRKSGHRLSIDDIRDLINTRPETIIAGTGVYGRMRSEQELENYLLQKNIQFIAEPNKKAIKIFNEMTGAGHVGACFHLTC